LEAVLGRTASTRVRSSGPRFTVHDELFNILADDGSVALEATSKADAYQRARVGGGVALPIEDLVEIRGV